MPVNTVDSKSYCQVYHAKQKGIFCGSGAMIIPKADIIFSAFIPLSTALKTALKRYLLKITCTPGTYAYSDG
jgi:hypothetical protein